MNPAVVSVDAFAHAIAIGEVELTDELRAAIAHLNAVCAQTYTVPTEPQPKEARA